MGLNLPVFLKGVHSEYIPKRTIQSHAVGQSARYARTLPLMRRAADSSVGPGAKWHIVEAFGGNPKLACETLRTRPVVERIWPQHFPAG